MYLCIKNSGPCSGLGPRSSHSWPRPRAGPCRAAKGVDRAVLAGHKVGVGGARGPQKFLTCYEVAIASSGGDDTTLTKSFIISLKNTVAN
jgi:hypothetical protein